MEQSDKLQNAPVLNACINESFRMDPPVNGGFCKAAKDIEHKGYRFASGVSILVGQKGDRVPST